MTTTPTNAPAIAHAVDPAPPAKPMSLYAAQTLLEQIEGLMEAEELDEAMLATVAHQYLEASDFAEAAVERYCFVIQKREQRFAVRDAEAKAQNAIARGLRTLANRDDSLIRRLKHSVLEFMDSRDIKRFETTFFALSTQYNNSAFKLVDENMPPTEELAALFPELCTVILDETKVKAYLKTLETPELKLPNGTVLAHLTRGRRLNLKPTATPE